MQAKYIYFRQKNGTKEYTTEVEETASPTAEPTELPTCKLTHFYYNAHLSSLMTFIYQLLYHIVCNAPCIISHCLLFK